MFLAHVICSDPGCHEELEIAVESLDELDGRVCDCGYGFVLASVSELAEPRAEVISMPVRPRAPRRGGERRAA